jgi:hypothetical protein
MRKLIFVLFIRWRAFRPDCDGYKCNACNRYVRRPYLWAHYGACRERS